MNQDDQRADHIAVEEVADSPMGLAMEEPEIVRCMKDAVLSGTEWHVALLEAVGKWALPEEEYRGRKYVYLIQGEAFDWLLLAERLCCELDGMVPQEETELLLFQGKLPREMKTQEFQELLGYNKHRAHLNHWYGVVVEEALQLAVEEEVRKQHRARGFSDSENLVEEAFVRLYEGTRTDLFREFLKGRKESTREVHSLDQIREFTYWLFKRRLEIWDPARVASDTRKGLEKLSELRSSDSFVNS